jgi:hypothetical protein
LCLDADYYGVGVRLEAGGLTIPEESGGRINSVYACFQFRFLTFGIGL